MCLLRRQEREGLPTLTPGAGGKGEKPGLPTAVASRAVTAAAAARWLPVLGRPQQLLLPSLLPLTLCFFLDFNISIFFPCQQLL